MSKFIRHLALRAHGNLLTVVLVGRTIVNVHYIW